MSNSFSNFALNLKFYVQSILYVDLIYIFIVYRTELIEGGCSNLLFINIFVQKEKERQREIEIVETDFWYVNHGVVGGSGRWAVGLVL